VPVTFFPVTSPVSKTFAYLALVLRAHYAICRYMFTVGFQDTAEIRFLTSQ